MSPFLLLFLLSLAAASGSPKTHSPRTAATVSSLDRPSAQPSIVSAGRAATDEVRPVTPAPEVVSLLARFRAATDDLTMQSETDAPFEVIFWPSDKPALAPAEVAVLSKQKAGAVVEIQSVEAFFTNAVLVEEGMTADEKATARRFEELSQMLRSELENPQVYLIGERERTVVIVGKVKGGFGGMITLVVET